MNRAPAEAEDGNVGGDHPAHAQEFQGPGVEILQSRSRERAQGHAGDLYGCLAAAFYAPNTGAVFVFHMNRRDHRVFGAAPGEILSIVIGEDAGKAP